MSIANSYALRNKKTATLTLSNFSYEEIIEGTVTITHNNWGSVTVDGNTVKNGDTSALITEDGAELVADPVEGASFVAWVKAGSNEIISHSATYTLKPYAASMNIWAVFTKPDQTPYYKIGTKLYTDLDTAISAASAGNDKTIVVISDGTLPKSYDIPSGITLLVPYAPTNTTIHTVTATVEGKSHSTLKHANMQLVSAYNEGDSTIQNSLLLPNENVTYTLTIPSGTTLNVAAGGKFIIGGTLAAGHFTSAGVSCATAGAHANVQLDGTLNVSGIMSVCGYVLGDGQVNITRGGTVHQPFTFMDYRNGPYVIKAEPDGTFCWLRYAMTNIQSDIHMVYGASLQGYVDLYTSTVAILTERHNVMDINLISTTGLIRLNEGATLDISYDPSRFADDADANHRAKGMFHRIGTTTMEFTGGLTVGSMNFDLTVQGQSASVNTTTDHFPIPYNYNIILNQGTYTLPQKLKLLAGATMTVNTGATLQISSGGELAVLAGLRDHVALAATSNLDSWYDYHYPSTAVLQAEPFNSNGAGNLILNGGTLQVDPGGSFGGLVQTTGNGSSKVIMNGNNTVTARVGIANATEINYVIVQADTPMTGRSLYELKAQLYGVNGELIDIVAGQRFVAANSDPHEVKNYSYKVFTSCTSDATMDKTQPLNATVIGTWKCETCKEYTSETKEPTCIDKGYTTHTCRVCGYSYVDTYTDALGHIPGEVVYENFNTTDGICDKGTTCTKCGEEIRESEYVVRFSGINVALDGDIYLTYTLYVLDPKATIVLTKPDPWDNDKTITETFIVADLTPDANGKYAVQMEIASGEMSRMVTIQVLNANGSAYQMFKNSNGASLGNSAAFSLLSYADLVLKKNENADGLTDAQKESIRKQKEIVTAMLTYGGYAQAYFKVDVENPAYNVLADYGIEVPSLEGITQDTVDGNVIVKRGNVDLGITAKSFDASLNYTVTMRIGFALDEGESISDYTFTLQRPGESKLEALEVEYDATTNRYYVAVKGIPAGYLNNNYIVNVHKAGSENPYIIEASVLAWSRIILNKETASEVQKDMARALYFYSTAADEFFGK